MRSDDPPGIRNGALLDQVHRVVRDGSCSTLSLDVFDTILWRRVPNPADLFEVFGSRLRTAGLTPDWLTDVSFRRIRVSAENEARQQHRPHGGEVSLFDIWAAMPAELFGAVPTEELVHAEVEVEREFTVVDSPIAEVIKTAAKSDVALILVSDTYFTDDQLRYLLQRPELELPTGTRVFRSLQYGLDKASGLWNSVLTELGQTPEQVLHIGDNEEADHRAPAALGVRTVHYRRIDHEFARLLDRERHSGESVGGGQLSTAYGDFGLTSLRAKTLQAVPATGIGSVEIAWRYGAAVLGPVLTGFAEWVAKRAHESGTSVVWCPMREGDLLARLITNAAATRGWNVTARPLWLSRQVTAMALIDAYDRSSVRRFIRMSYRLTVGQLLSMLNLRPGDVPALSEQRGALLDCDEIIDRVTHALTETPHLTNRLASSITATREGLLRSLRSAGALDHDELSLVDLGWGTTIQLQLAQVLRMTKASVTVSGYYVATDGRASRLHQQGLRAEGYLGQTGHPHRIVEVLRRSPEVIEQCVSAVCGSLVDVHSDGSPVLGPCSGTETQNAERLAVQDGVVSFQQQWNHYVDNASRDWPELTNPDAADQLATILGAALRGPTPDEAGVFGNWHHDDNLGSDVVTSIVPEDLSAALPYLSPNDLDELDMRDAFWPALIAASDPQLAAGALAKSNGTIPASAFEQSGQPPECHLRYRIGDDEWHDGPRKCVRINHNGLSFARLSFHAPDTTYVSLALPGRPAIVRIDWIEASVFINGDPEPTVLRWEAPEDLAGLTLAECDWVGGNLIQFNQAHSALWLPLAMRAGGPVTFGRITAAFAVLPQSNSGFASRMSPAPSAARLAGRLGEEYRAKGAAGVAAGAARLAMRRLSKK